MNDRFMRVLLFVAVAVVFFFVSSAQNRGAIAQSADDSCAGKSLDEIAKEGVSSLASLQLLAACFAYDAENAADKTVESFRKGTTEAQRKLEDIMAAAVADLDRSVQGSISGLLSKEGNPCLAGAESESAVIGDDWRRSTLSCLMRSGSAAVGQVYPDALREIGGALSGTRDRLLSNAMGAVADMAKKQAEMFVLAAGKELMIKKWPSGTAKNHSEALLKNIYGIAKSNPGIAMKLLADNLGRDLNLIDCAPKDNDCATARTAMHDAMRAVLQDVARKKENVQVFLLAIEEFRLDNKKLAQAKEDLKKFVDASLTQVAGEIEKRVQGKVEEAVAPVLEQIEKALAEGEKIKERIGEVKDAAQKAWAEADALVSGFDDARQFFEGASRKQWGLPENWERDAGNILYAAAYKALPGDVKQKISQAESFVESARKITSGGGDIDTYTAAASAVVDVLGAGPEAKKKIGEAARVAKGIQSLVVAYSSGNPIAMASIGMSVLGGGGLPGGLGGDDGAAAARHEEIMAELREISAKLDKIDRKLDEVIELQRRTLVRLDEIENRLEKNHQEVMEALDAIRRLQAQTLARINFYGASFTRECFATGFAVKLVGSSSLASKKTWDVLRANRSLIAACLHGLQLFLQNAKDGRTYSVFGISPDEATLCRAGEECEKSKGRVRQYYEELAALRAIGLFDATDLGLPLSSYSIPVADTSGLHGKIRHLKSLQETGRLPVDPYDASACPGAFEDGDGGRYQLLTDERSPLELLEMKVDESWILQHAELAAAYHGFFDLLPALAEERPSLKHVQSGNAVAARVLLCSARIALRIAISQQAVASGDYTLEFMRGILLKKNAGPDDVQKQKLVIAILQRNKLLARNLALWMTWKSFRFPETEAPALLRPSLGATAYGMAFHGRETCKVDGGGKPKRFGSCMMTLAVPDLAHHVHRNANKIWVLRFSADGQSADLFMPRPAELMSGRFYESILMQRLVVMEQKIAAELATYQLLSQGTCSLVYDPSCNPGFKNLVTQAVLVNQATRREE